MAKFQGGTRWDSNLRVDVWPFLVQVLPRHEPSQHCKSFPSTSPPPRPGISSPPSPSPNSAG
ncbi:hypothetical protein E2C01_094193 [Portunus trituberculatus]|uniref:Uncharacterized protein n=1 Tax=Portunus trituberculatus TaxID=210409 RepID=A0A5B7JPT0_PORTR|nr:hypothetical protein [Portunus trituberculatus]